MHHIHLDICTQHMLLDPSFLRFSISVPRKGLPFHQFFDRSLIIFVLMSQRSTVCTCLMISFGSHGMLYRFFMGIGLHMLY